MFAHALLSPEGLTNGLIRRRLKWHQGEHNYILSRLKDLPESMAEKALAVATSHKWASLECEALLRGEEPAWGGPERRQEVESCLRWAPELGAQPEANP